MIFTTTVTISLILILQGTHFINHWAILQSCPGICFACFLKEAKQCSRLHGTQLQDRITTESQWREGACASNIVRGNKHLWQQAYVTPYLFSLGYCLLRFSENPIPNMGLSTWTGELVTFTIHPKRVFFYIAMTFCATLSTFQFLWDFDPTIASKKISGVAIWKWGKAASPTGVQYICRIGFSGQCSMKLKNFQSWKEYLI